MTQLNDGIPRDARSQRLTWITCENCGKQRAAPARQRFCSKTCARSGEHSSTWKGGRAGYHALHYRVRRARGKPDHCSRCGRNDPAAKYEWANLTGDYGDVNDYAPMCKQCHQRYDGQVGSSHYCAKLTEQLVIQIRERHARGEQQVRLAAEFGVSPSVIYSVVRRRTWKSVP